MFYWGLIIGLFIGCFIGIFIFALCVIARKADDALDELILQDSGRGLGRVKQTGHHWYLQQSNQPVFPGQWCQKNVAARHQRPKVPARTNGGQATNNRFTQPTHHFALNVLKTLAQTELRCFRFTSCASEMLQRQQPVTITSHSPTGAKVHTGRRPMRRLYPPACKPYGLEAESEARAGPVEFPYGNPIQQGGLNINFKILSYEDI